jgi:hypothetical protein
VRLSELGWVIRSIWPEATNSVSLGQPIPSEAVVVVVAAGEEVVVEVAGGGVVTVA